jgi:Uma2 family endonuclease
MALPAHDPGFTAADYLAWEAVQPDKHEYVAGEVFAMGGASRAHVTVAGNVFNEISNRIEDTPCRVYMADMKLRVEAVDAYFYPDVLVTCDEADRRADQFMSSPGLVVEILSPSTAAYDRGDKFAAYRRLESLQQYVLVDPDQRRIESYTRTADGQWLLRDIDPGTPLPLPVLAAELSWERIFRNLD